MPYDYSTDTLTLKSGDTLPAITSHYETYGQLNHDRSNAILLCHTLTANAVVTGETGWWDYYVGPHKSIDTTRYHVICITVLGSCKGSTCPDSYAFPVITIHDMVAVQARLLDKLGIQKLAAVIGGSMGGMQAIIWAIDYPDRVDLCLPIATTSRLSTQALAFNTIGRQAIMTHDHDGLPIARMLGHTTYLSNARLSERFGRKLQNQTHYSYRSQSDTPDFQIESYLIHQGHKFSDNFDHYSYYYLSKAISYFDLDTSYTSLDRAFIACKSRFFFIAIDSDWLYPPDDSKRMVRALVKLGKSVRYATLHSPDGHDGFLLPNKHLASLLGSVL